ncbi:hypothetical protein PIB30_068081 [Stylosanthes scabra]|uniref:Uncharacterized protein n=1 Tax=Stylosanthes scabra TaxID=79078 RepID=A0ABU6QMS3_9FABA|nr:hypothetical protein [Stylosanthes scabra]
MVTQTELDSEENITFFKRAFILYIQKALLYPNNSTSLYPKTPPTVLDVIYRASMNWVRHVYIFLFSGIQEMRKKNLKSVGWCVFALLVIYFHETHHGEESEKAEAQPPWLAYWKDETLQKRIKDEFEDPGGLVNQARSRVPKMLPSAEKKKTTTKKKGWAAKKGGENTDNEQHASKVLTNGRS